MDAADCACMHLDSVLPSLLATFSTNDGMHERPFTAAGGAMGTAIEVTIQATELNRTMQVT